MFVKHPMLTFENMKYHAKQSVSKWKLDPIPDELKDMECLEKNFISKRILFTKTAIMYGKGNFSKIKGAICNALIESVDICNVISRSADSNGLIIGKLKRDLKYRFYLYF